MRWSSISFASFRANSPGWTLVRQVYPVGARVTVGSDRDHDRDRTTVIKREEEPRDKTVIIKKEREEPSSPWKSSTIGASGGPSR